MYTYITYLFVYILVHNFVCFQVFLEFILQVNGKQWMTCQIYLMLEEDHGTFTEQVHQKI